MLTTGCTAGLALRHFLAPPVCPVLGTLPFDTWLPTLEGLIANTWVHMNSHTNVLFLVTAACAGLLWVVIPTFRHRAVNAFQVAAALTVAAIVILLFMATRIHVRDNECAFRYAVQATLFLEIGLVSIIVGPPYLAAGRFGRQLISVGAVIGFVAAMVVGYGFPSFSAVRADLTIMLPPGTEQTRSLSAAEVIDERCTHVAGDYWQVWPVVFQANLTMADRHMHRLVWGVTLRSTPTQACWNQIPLREMRVAVPPGPDPAAIQYLRDYGFPPLVVVKKLSTIWVMRPRSIAENGDGE